MFISVGKNFVAPLVIMFSCLLALSAVLPGPAVLLGAANLPSPTTVLVNGSHSNQTKNSTVSDQADPCPTQMENSTVSSQADPCPTDVKDLKEMLELASLPTGGHNKGVVFTTVTIDKGHASHVEWVSNWYGQLLKVGVPHPIIFGTDYSGETCAIVRALGICCRDFTTHDFRFTKAPKLVHSRDGSRPAAVDIKFSYAHELLSHGYRISFSDDDVYWFKHPFSYEFEEDMRGLTDDMSGLDQDDGWTASDCGLDYGSPCMSTGLWDVYPTKNSIDFISGIVQTLSESKEWEQYLANLLLQKEAAKAAATTGLPSRFTFRLFPKSTHANVGVLDSRFANNTTMDLSAVHLGYVHGGDKLIEYKKRGLWSPKNFSNV